MATPKETTWDIEPHTLAKHKILKNYLNAWFPIINRYNPRLIYLDGFSGPGIYNGGEPGSPIIALNVAKDHFKPIKGEAVFLFIEEREDRAENLKVEVRKISLPESFRVYVENNEFESTVQKILNELDKGGVPLAPTFAFVDPFGFSGVPFDLLARLLKNDRSEAFITFMVSSINRFLSVSNDEIREHIRKLFGTDEVFGVVEGHGDRVKALTQLYQRQLNKLGKFVRSFEMRDSNDNVIYYLQFVTNHRLGHLKMKEAMWQADSEGDFRFSDATDPSQEVLFHAQHDKALFGILTKKYIDRTLEVSQIKQYVEDETPYLDKHLRESLRYGEQNSLISVDEYKKDGAKRRKNTFPDGVVVSFET